MQEFNFPDSIKNAPMRTLNKGEILLRSGEFCNEVYRVVKGCLRGYTIDERGREHIFIFAPEDWILGDQGSLLSNLASVFTIDTIEDSVIRVMSRPADIKLENLDKASLIGISEKFQNRIMTLQSCVIQLLSASAEERYTSFNQTYPNLVQRVPQKMIASYLGITPEGLSRVRKKISGKK